MLAFKVKEGPRAGLVMVANYDDGETVHGSILKPDGRGWVSDGVAIPRPALIDHPVKLRSAWELVQEQGHVSYLRADGARVGYRPANSADKAWMAFGPGGERRLRQCGRAKLSVKYLTPYQAMRACDRDWPMALAESA